MIVCMTMLGPPAAVLVVVWGMDVGLVPITKPKNGSGFAPTMGLDGAVCRSGSDVILSLNNRLYGLLMV